MRLEFWSKVKSTDTFYLRVQQEAKEGVESFKMQLNDVKVRRGFWKYALDHNDFSQWPRECQIALCKKAWYEAFLTITDYPQAIAITFAATSMTLFALSFVTGASLTLFTCVMASALICAASYMMDNQEDEPEDTAYMGNQAPNGEGSSNQSALFDSIRPLY